MKLKNGSAGRLKPGEWMYLYRAVDRDGKTLDFMFSERRDTSAATKFFASALADNGIPKRIVIDRSRATATAIKEVNKILKRVGCLTKIKAGCSKYLHNVVEQDHRSIKRRIRPIFGFKSFRSGSAVLEGTEVAQMMPIKQFASQATQFAQFEALAEQVCVQIALDLF